MDDATCTSKVACSIVLCYRVLSVVIVVTLFVVRHVVATTAAKHLIARMGTNFLVLFRLAVRDQPYPYRHH
jgi:hypothetical protein